MKVNIEAQCLCTPNIRGIPYYTLNLIRSLLKRRNNIDFSVSFFDFMKERDNRQYLNKYFNPNEIDQMRIYECNTMDYRKIMEANLINDSSVYNNTSYCDFFGTGFDVIHFPSTFTLPVNISMGTVVTVHDITPVKLKNLRYITNSMVHSFDNIQKMISQRKDILVIADSQYTKDDFSAYYDVEPERIFVTHLAYDRETIYPCQNKDILKSFGIDQPYLLYLGKLDLHKGVIYIINSFNIIKDKYPGIKLVLAGESSKIFEDACKKNHFSFDDIIMTGYVSEEAKRVLLSSALVFLFPSEYEGFGLPVIEAMACGAPVVTSSTSSLPEVGGNAALYADPYNVEEIAYQTSRVIDDTSLREQMIARGYENIKKFSWDKTAELTENVYRKAFDIKTGG